MTPLGVRACGPWIGGILVALTAWPGAVAAGPPPAVAPAEVVRRSRQRVAVCAEWLATRERLAARGVVPVGDVEDARLSLARARCQLAREEGRPGEVAAQLKAVVALCEREWQRLYRMDTTATTEGERDRARRRLAAAGLWLAWEVGDDSGALEQVHTLVAVTHAEVRRCELGREPGAALCDSNAARRRALLAQQLHARAEDRAEDTGQLGRAYQKLCAEELARLEGLRRQGAATADEVAFARMVSIEAGVRQALWDQRPERAREGLRELARVCDGLVEAWGRQPPPDPRELPALLWKAALVRALLASAEEGSWPTEIIFAYELES